MEYGTAFRGGVNPKKAGTEHCGVPVFASAREAMREGGFDVSVIFITPLGAKAAALDAIEAGAKAIDILTEHIPVQDVLQIMAAARATSLRIRDPHQIGKGAWRARV